jgi:hypothetical protein
MSVCLNPQGGHPASEVSPQRFFCTMPGCGHLLEGAIVGKCRVISFFIQGPASSLYLAAKGGGENISAPRMVVKVVHSPVIQPLTQLEQAVNQMLSLDHPHIHHLESIGLLGQNGPLYMVAPFQEQGSLARFLAQPRGLPGQVVAGIVRQIADALHSAHEAGVVHGRLKPENCLIVSPATVQVADFYNQLLAEVEPSASPLYMAPEQAYERLGPFSDQYALAILAFQLLTGQAPFNGPNRRAIISQHIQNDPPLVNSFRPELPRQVDAIIRRALNKRPAERFPSILAFAAAFQTALGSRPGATGPLNPLDTALRPLSQPAQLAAAIPEPAPAIRRIPNGAVPLSILPGHTGDIRVLRWAPNGMLLASAGADQNIFLWDVRQKVAAMLARYEAHQNEILALCWSPDSKLFAASANDATISLWEVPDAGRSALGEDTGTMQKAWWGHDGSITTLDWSPDSTRIASGGSDRTVRLWEKTGKGLAGWQAHGRGGVTVLAWAPDSQTLASGGGDRQIQIWDPTNGSPICTCDGHSDEVRHLAWSPDGNMLASAAGKKDLRILLWNPHTGQQIGQFNGHSRQIIGMFWAADGTWLATAGADRRIRFWGTQQQIGQQICRPIEIDGTPLLMAGAPNSGLVALSLDTMSIILLQLTWR